MLDLDKLERLAKNATPGPWVGRGNHIFCVDNKRLVYVEAERALDLQTADYIVAACNAVPELIARVRELERMADIMAEQLACVEIAPSICCGCKEQDMFGMYSCGGKDCIYFMVKQAAKEAEKPCP